MSRKIASAFALLAAVAAFASLPSLADAGGCSSGYGRASYGYVNHHVYPKVVHRPIVHRPVVHHPVVVHRPIVKPIVKVVEKHVPVVVEHPVAVPVAPPVDHCHHPKHCYTWVLPGDTLDVICQREYGDPGMWRRVAEYNKLTTVLPTDRPLLLPSIYDSGRMIPSTAPAPEAPLAAPLAAEIPAAPLAAPAL